MPESPEVAFLAQKLTSEFGGRTLSAVEILSGRYKRHGAPKGFHGFVQALPARLQNVSKKGKVLFFEFNNGWTIISRLGLTGFWYKNNEVPKWKVSPHVGMSFTFGRDRMAYDDQLSYGTLVFCKQDEAQKVKEGLAPDIMDVKWMAVKERVHKLRASKKIEDVLVDQKAVVSGIGNYLKSEILYDAKIAPMRKVGTLSDEDWRCLLRSARNLVMRIVKVMTEGSEDDYEKTMRVYRKKTDRKGNKVVSYTSDNGRTTYWVPSVQK